LYLGVTEVTLGFFPDLRRADKATRKYIARDPEEAGFATKSGSHSCFLR
jgi:hypothetical protein